MVEQLDISIDYILANLELAGNFNAYNLANVQKKAYNDKKNYISFLNSLKELNASITGAVETDPIFTASVASSITSTDIINWNDAFSWGDHAIAGYTPSTRTLTINGITFDLSADRSWSISSGVTTMGAIGSTPNANGSTISGTTLTLQPASASFGGVVTTDTQTFAGNKKYLGRVSIDSNNGSMNPLGGIHVMEATTDIGIYLTTNYTSPTQYWGVAITRPTSSYFQLGNAHSGLGTYPGLRILGTGGSGGTHTIDLGGNFSGVGPAGVMIFSSNMINLGNTSHNYQFNGTTNTVLGARAVHVGIAPTMSSASGDSIALRVSPYFPSSPNKIIADFGENTANADSGTHTPMLRIFPSGVSINNAGINSSAIFEISSTSKGFLSPRMTTTERNAITTPATGLLIYNVTTLGLEHYNGTAWVPVGGGSETDPVFTASPAFSITSTDITNWNNAYSWGDHSLAGYLTSFTELDPVFSSSPAFGITGANITNWNTAFSWGNHASAGYAQGTGASGQVTYWTGSGTQAGSNNLFWNNTNSRLGIGTATPTSNLFVYSNNSSTTVGDNNSFILHNNNPSMTGNNLTELFFSDAGQATGTANGLDLQHRYAGISGYVAGWSPLQSSGGLNFVTRATNGSSLTTKMQIRPNGNVIIQDGGTFTDAGYKLDVNGSFRTRLGFDVYGKYTDNDGATETTIVSIITSSGWTVPADWTGDNVNGFVHTPGATGALTNSAAIVSGGYYSFTLTMTGRTAGSINIAFGGFSAGPYTGGGTIFVTTTATNPLTITPTSDFNGTIKIGVTRYTNKTTGGSFRFFKNNGSGGCEIRVLEDANTFSIGTGGGQYQASGGRFNTFIGISAGKNNVLGVNNTFIGWDAGGANTIGNSNHFIGTEAGRYTTTGFGNIAIGYKAFRNSNTGTGNVYLGDSAGSAHVGNYNVGIGYGTLNNNGGTGANNIGIGTGNMVDAVLTGSNNIGIGGNAARALSANADIISIGRESFRALTGSGSFSIAIGYRAGRHVTNTSTNLTNSSNSIYLGADSFSGIDGATNEIVIGTGAVGLGSNTVILGSSSITLTALRGQVGVNTTTPVASAQFQVDSTTKGLLIPRMTTSERDGILSAANGLQVYNTTTSQPNYRDGSTWQAMVGMTFGTAAPTSTPTAVGNFFLDTTNKKLYVSTGTASSADWNILN